MFDDIVGHFQSIQDFTQINEEDTGADRRAYGDTLRTVSTQQAMPYLYRKSVVPIVVIGKDITMKDYFAQAAFWTGQGQASSLAADMLRRIIRVEATALGREWEWNDASMDFNAFPFVNLWCWLRHTQLGAAIDFLRAYMCIVRPLIAVTFSKPVNSILRADFAKSWKDMGLSHGCCRRANGTILSPRRKLAYQKRNGFHQCAAHSPRPGQVQQQEHRASQCLRLQLESVNAT